MTTTNTTATNEATTYLEAHGFTHEPGADWYDSPGGHARVAVLDAEAACFAVYAFTHDRARLVVWQAQLHNAPLPVFTATVTAATT